MLCSPTSDLITPLQVSLGLPKLLTGSPYETPTTTKTLTTKTMTTKTMPMETMRMEIMTAKNPMQCSFLEGWCKSWRYVWVKIASNINLKLTQ